MHQHLVHHHLEEQRGDQGEKLEGERHQDDLAQQLAVFDQRRDEPGEIESGQFAGERGAGGEEDELTAPAGAELVEGEKLRPLGPRIVDEHPLAFGAGEDEEAPLQIRGQRRQRRVREPPAIRAHVPGLEPQVFGREQNLGNAERPSGLFEVVSQLAGVGGHAVEAGEHDQARQAGIHALRGRLPGRRASLKPHVPPFSS